MASLYSNMAKQKSVPYRQQRERQKKRTPPRQKTAVKGREREREKDNSRAEVT